MTGARHSMYGPIDGQMNLLYAYATNSDSWGGYKASASGTYTGDGGTIRPNMAFRAGNPVNTYRDAWSAPGSKNHWLQIKLDEPKCARMLGICSRYGLFINTPPVSHLYGSTDGYEFDKLLDVIFESPPVNTDEVLFNIKNSKKYLYYRLHCDGCFGDRISIGRLRLYGR